LYSPSAQNEEHERFVKPDVCALSYLLVRNNNFIISLQLRQQEHELNRHWWRGFHLLSVKFMLSVRLLTPFSIGLGMWFVEIRVWLAECLYSYDASRRVHCIRRIRRVMKSERELRQACLSVRLSAWNNSAPNWRIFMKFNNEQFF
jgi:hypothetical protein